MVGDRQLPRRRTPTHRTWHESRRIRAVKTELAIFGCCGQRGLRRYSRSRCLRAPRSRPSRRAANAQLGAFGVEISGSYPSAKSLPHIIPDRRVRRRHSPRKLRMATVAQSQRESPRALDWFLEFLKEELAPVPGRAGIVARMVIAAALVMIICETFRIPYAFEAAIYTLIISRASPRATLRSAGTTFLFVGVGGAYVLISAGFVISVPILHFLWVIASFVLTFYALSAMTNYGAASTFALVIAVGIPIWERHVSAETNVEDTLWLTLAVSVGALVTAAIELAFAHANPGDEIALPIAERLSAVESFLDCS